MTIYRNVSTALPALAERIVVDGDTVPSRNGETKELTHQHITLTNPLERAVITPHRRASLAAQIAETAWVLAGRNDVAWLARYLPRAPEFADDGEHWKGGYGPSLRDWHGKDQLEHVIRLLNADRDTRRAVITLYDPARDMDGGKDVPCNNWLHFLARDGALDLSVAVRSNDLVWGWSGINAFEWSTLLEVVARYTGLWTGKLHFSISSLHVYERHYKRALRYVPPTKPYSDPIAFFPASHHLDSLLDRFFEAEEKIREGLEFNDIVDRFPEPMLRSWLRVLAYHWTGKECYLDAVGAGLHIAALEEVPTSRVKHDLFADEVVALHTEKHQAYGDSWMKRGEMLSITANIARKIDRLGGAETSDESSADTAIDLLVYLAKYRWWLSAKAEAPYPIFWDSTISDIVTEPDATNALIRLVQPHEDAAGDEEAWLVYEFETLAKQAEHKHPKRWHTLDDMLRAANNLARRRWQVEKDHKLARDKALMPTVEWRTSERVWGREEEKHPHADRNITRMWNPDA